MKSFNIPSEKRKIFRDEIDKGSTVLLRRLQAGVSILANQKLGSIHKPNGIFKCEGGVACNGREIAIKDDYVIDDFRHPIDETPEEVAVAEALEALVEKVNCGDSLEEYAESANRIHGDHLISFVGFNGW